MDKPLYLLTNQLSEADRKIVESIMTHIGQGERRTGIQQIARENYVSTTYIMKMCKRLGFDGYSELYYSLSRQTASEADDTGEDALKAVVDNYSPELIDTFCRLITDNRDNRMFTTGEGFSGTVVSYIVQRLNVCGFLAYHHVNFYDFMHFHNENPDVLAQPQPSLMFAVSQSGEAKPVLLNVSQARELGHKVISFTKRTDSELAALSDACFIIDGEKQTLIAHLPNLFFAHVIMAFEELMAVYFQRQK